MKKPLKHIVDYLVLSFLMSTAIILILFFAGNRFYQMIIIVSTSVLYFIWGLLHHLKEGTVHPKVIMEYLLFALLGCALSIGLLI